MISKVYCSALILIGVFICLSGSLHAQTAQTGDDGPKNKGKKLWENKVKVFFEVKFTRPNFNFPPEIYFSPAYRWGGQQVASVTPPIPNNWLNTFSVGFNFYPLPVSVLNNLYCGYSADFKLGYGNNFRGGKFLTIAQYANGENAFTYARMSKHGRVSTFRAGYDNLPIWKTVGKDGAGTVTEGIFLEFGPKYSQYSNVETTQGYDTFDEDVIYRTTNGEGQSAGGFIYVKIMHASSSIGVKMALRLGLEYEKGFLEFKEFPGKRSFSSWSIGFFGLELTF